MTSSTPDDDDLDALLEPRETIARLRAEAEAAKSHARDLRARLAEHEPQAGMTQDELGRVWAIVEALPEEEAYAEMKRLGMIESGAPTTVRPSGNDDAPTVTSAPLRQRGW
jgi:hypothetical protein